MLEYKIRQTGDVTILDLSGRISVGEALAFGPGSGVVLAEVVRGLAKKGQRKILLNLKDVTYADSSGLGDLVGSLASLQRQGGELKLLNPNPRLSELLRITHVYQLFEIKDDEVSAIQSFSKPTAAAG
jgi:anti-sigma B factor antagonist